MLSKKHFTTLICMFILLIAVFSLSACDSFEDMVQIVFHGGTPEPSMTAEPVAVTPQPTEGPTQEPTVLSVIEPTPEPTPTPTPTPVVKEYLGQSEWENLLMDYETIQVKTPPNRRVTLYSEPSLRSESETYRNRTTTGFNEVIILGTVPGDDENEFYFVQSSFSKDRGYVLASKTKDSKFSNDQVTGAYAIMQRPGSVLFQSTEIEGKVNAQEDYHAVRILGVSKGMYYVVSQDGNFGYMDPAQLRIVTREEMIEYFNLAKTENPHDSFFTESFVEYLEESDGMEVSSIAEFVFDRLKKEGLYMNPGYYNYLKKPLGDTTYYPDGLYQDDVYNSLLFKLWNSAGNFALNNGKETQWDYIDKYEDVIRGDLIFMSSYGHNTKNVLPNVEVVVRGKYSGYITNMYVALGDDRVLTTVDGKNKIIDNFSKSSEFPYFDSARRIQPEVTDTKSHFLEKLISAVYDRLGTPYNNYTRTGDASYDCSGIVCWGLRTMGAHRSKGNMKTLMPETTASGLATTKQLYLNDGTKLKLDYLNPYTRVTDDLKQLERGDFVFLNAEKHAKVSHVMIYLGNNTVIHSTTIDHTYRGTLVAQIRPELKKLYSVTNHIIAVD